MVPLVLYAAWWIAAPKLTGPVYLTDTHLRLENALLIPNFVADAAAAVLAALAGLGHDFAANLPLAGGGSAPDIGDPAWGLPLAAALAIGLALRLRSRPRPPSSLWVSLATLLAFWVSIAMVSGLNRYPVSQRYAYTGAVLLLLVTSSALAGLRLPRRLVPAVFAVTALALGASLYQDRVASSVLRSYSTVSRATLAVLEIARAHVDPGFIPPDPTVSAAYQVVGGAGPTLDAVERNGSFAFSLAELRAQPESVREVADDTLAKALGLGVKPLGPRSPAAGCRRVAGAGRLTVRPPGVIMRSATPRSVAVSRFGDAPTVEVGSLAAGETSLLEIPADDTPDPWRVQVSPEGPLTVCEPASVSGIRRE